MPPKNKIMNTPTLPLAEPPATFRALEIPAALNDRAAEVWEPLLVLADLAGGAWPEKARAAATALLLDIFVAFKLSGADRLHSRVLVETLKEFGQRPWRQTKGEINETWLAHRLRPYGIKTKTIWIGETSDKGYLMDDFKEVFHRYITPTDLDSLRPIPDSNPTLNLIPSSAEFTGSANSACK